MGGAQGLGSGVGLEGGYLVVMVGILDGVQTERTDRVSEWNELERNEMGRDARDGAFFWGARGL